MKYKIRYKSIAYAIHKGFLNKEDAEFYIYWGHKLDSIVIDDLPLVDKVFVLMCINQNFGEVHYDLEHEYKVLIDKNDVYNILVNCQSSDIEITVMAKSFLYYQNIGTKYLEEQIYHIMEYGKINLPYTYDLL